jgi:hypothetical protein
LAASYVSITIFDELNKHPPPRYEG